MSDARFTHSPAVYGSVTLSTAFTHGGVTYTARGLWSSADGTITVTMADGTTGVTKQVFRGINVFQLSQVTANSGSLTLEWFA